MLQLRQLIPDYGDDIAMIAVSLDTSKEQTAKFADQNDLDFDIYVNPDESALVALGLRYIPTLVLLDESGKVTVVAVGAKPDKEMRAMLDDLLNKD